MVFDVNHLVSFLETRFISLAFIENIKYWQKILKCGYIKDEAAEQLSVILEYPKHSFRKGRYYQRNTGKSDK